MHNARDSPIKYLQGEQAAGRTVCLKQFRNKEIESPPHAEFEWSVATQSAKEQGKPRNEDAETPSKSSLLLDFSFLPNKQSTRKRNALILLVSVLRITRLIHAHIIGLILEMIKPRRLDIRSLQFDYESHRLSHHSSYSHRSSCRRLPSCPALPSPPVRCSRRSGSPGRSGTGTSACPQSREPWRERSRRTFP